MSLSRLHIAATTATAASALALAMCACAPIHMAVPADLAAGSHVYEVQNRTSWKGALVDESFSFGPYRVTKVDRDWTSSSGWGVGAYSTTAIKTGYAYVLVTATGEIPGHCGVEAEKKDVAVLGGHLSAQHGTLACACGTDTTGTRFVIQGDNGAPMSGGAELRGAADKGEGSLVVTPIDHDDHGNLQPLSLGWELRGAGPVGAVETPHPGRFWLQKGLAPATADQVACLLAGMLLYDPPQRQQ